MKLHENTILFRQAVQFTADQMKIKPIYVEKDYWVTFVLLTIFNNEIGNDTIFKGGTALSKCFKLIERFSEEKLEHTFIDLLGKDILYISKFYSIQIP